MNIKSDFNAHSSEEASIVTMYETQHCLVVPIQQELSREAAKGIQTSLLAHIHKKSIKGVLIDLSGVNIIDSVLWSTLLKTVQMIKMLGAQTIITGLSPGVVASIIDFNVETDDFTTALTLEAGLVRLSASIEEPTNLHDDIKNNIKVEESTVDFSKDDLI
jgi:rsbT antagonist protein RsbS